LAQPDVYVLGAILLAAGLALFLAVRFLVRLVPGPGMAAWPSFPPEAAAWPVDEGRSSRDEAVLLVRPGGRILSANARARQVYNLQEGEAPNLERLARRTQPPEKFLELCAQAGQASLTIDGRRVDGSSYRVPALGSLRDNHWRAAQPDGQASFILVTLRFPEIPLALFSEDANRPADTLRTFVELTQAMNASLDLQATVQSILAGFESLIRADFSEMTLWNSDNKLWVPYRLVGLPGVEREMQVGTEQLPASKGNTATLMRDCQPILVTEGEDHPSASGLEASQFRSYLGVPLVAGEKVLGAIEFKSLDRKAFSQPDLELLKLFSPPAAVAIQNATLYMAEQRRAAELNSLAQLSQAFVALRDPKDLFNRLVLSIASLIKVKILGFLLYNEYQHTLEGQVPFQGLPDQFILSFYRVVIQPKSLAENTLLSQDVVISENALEDPHWVDLGFDAMARAAGLRDTAFIPLSSAGRILGYLQASNHLDQGTTFKLDELHILTIIATQAAPIIENANLVLQTRQRAQRAEALRRIASLASSAANLDEILQFSLRDLVHLLQAETGVLFLVDRAGEVLSPHPGSAYGLLPEAVASIDPLPLADPQFGFTVTGRMHTLFSNSLSEEETLLPTYQAIARKLNMVSAIIVPLVVRDRGIGEMWLGHSSPDFFDRSDLQTVTTAGGQLAAVVEQSVLAVQTDDTLRRRVDQLTALTRIGRELSTSLDLKYLLQTVYDEAMLATRADCGTIMLFELTELSPIPIGAQFYAGDAPGPWLSKLDRTVLESCEPLAVADFSQPANQAPPTDPPAHSGTPKGEPDRVHRSPLPLRVSRSGFADAEGGSGEGDAEWIPPHAGVQSALVVPLLYQEKVAGLIELHSLSPNRFDAAVVENIQALAIQAALVLGNALEYREQTQTIQRLGDQVRRIRDSLEITVVASRQADSQAVLSTLANEVLTRLDMDATLVAVAAPDGPSLSLVSGDIPPGANPEALFGQRNPLRQAFQDGELLLVEDLERGSHEWQDAPLLHSLEARGFVCLPVVIDNRVDAALLALSRQPVPPFTSDDRQAYQLMAHQVAITLQNLSLLTETRRRLREVNLLLEFSRQLGSQDQMSVLNALVTSVLRALPPGPAAMVMLWDENGKQLVPQVAVGYTDNSTLVEIIYRAGDSGQKPPLPLQVLMDGRPRRIAEVDFADDYHLPADDLLRYRQATAGRLPVSSLLVPIQSGETRLGLLLLDHFTTPAAFSAEDEALIVSLAQQTAVAIQNARLTAGLEKRVQERTTELTLEKRNTETLLTVITELSSSLDLGQVLNRTLTVLNNAVEADQSAIFLAKEGALLPYFRSTSDRSNLALSDGWMVTLPETELVDRVLKQRQSVLVEDLVHDPRFLKAPPDPHLPYRCALGVLLVMGEEVLGVLLLYSARLNSFNPGQVSLVEAAARQISVSLNNAELYNLIRDQAENLGGLLRDQQIEASRSRAILEAVADGVLVTDAGNRITLFNASAERNLDLQASQVLGQSLEQFSGLFGHSGRSWMHTIHLWSSDPKSYQPGETYSDQITVEKGKIIAIHLAPVFLRSQFLGTVSIFRDISHEVQVDRLKSEFVANVSHELRTPMTSIKGYVEIMLMGASGPITDQQRHVLEVVKNNAQRLNILVNDLLDVSRIEAGRVTLSFEALDLGEMAQEAGNELVRRSREENKPMSVTLDVQPGLPMVEGDAVRVRQILNNLASNAFNYTPENGKVIIRLHSRDDQVQVDVEDSGIGIAKADQGRIFERFYRGEDPLVLATSGTGLGLSIVKSLVEMHHGQIWFSSSGEPGQGSVFSFTLPQHQVSE
jgi:GAF domain-containing protein/two-component sensor histidine kinase